MINYRELFALVLLALLLLAPHALFAETSNTVNERIPVQKTEMEQHWQLDCADSWAELRKSATSSPNQSHCGVPPELQRAIQLCAFIYQPPGSADHSSCPDYQAAHTAAQRGNCGSLTNTLQHSTQCH